VQLHIGESRDSGFGPSGPPRNDERKELMRTTILFGGTNKERLVSVASAQALHSALPEADLWFWDVDDTVHEAASEALLKHGGRSRRRSSRRRQASAKSKRRSTKRAPRTACWCSACTAAPRRMASCRRCARCAALPSPVPARRRRISPSTSAAKRFAALAGLKAPDAVAVEDIETALAAHGRLIAKPARDGSSYGLIFVNAKQDLVAVRNAARTEEYVIEPFIAGVEATCGVLEQVDGSVIALPPVEIIPAEGAFDYVAKYIAKATQESVRPGSQPTSTQKSWIAPYAPQGAVLQRLFPFGFHRDQAGADFSRKPTPCPA